MGSRVLAPGALVLACALWPTVASAADTGGTSAPEPRGDAMQEQATALAARLRLRAVGLSPRRVRPADAGALVTLRFRALGTASRVRVKVWVGTGAAARTVREGLARRGVTTAWRLRLPGDLRPGEHALRLRATDARPVAAAHRARPASGRAVLTVLEPEPAPAPTPTPAATPQPASGGVFPVAGPWTFGAEGAQFGAARGDRSHRGQDVLAAQGTPLVAPVSGTVTWVAYQAGGAGHYLVIRGAGTTDYVFMHLREATPLARWATVAAGQPIGAVGMTGSASGPHLHFEIWPAGWYASAPSAPIDPRPQLEAWAAASSAR
jgi:murein DD-endopeptidase MepM/ murein hydrolase activator NlpD